MSLPVDLREALAGVASMGAITGAGVSQESGIRTYRGQGGLYDDEAEGDRTVEALSGHTLRADPDRTWHVVGELARSSSSARPNEAHRALARIEEVLERFVLLTQNVDGLHGAAGSRNVIEIHGNVRNTRCMVCGVPGRLERSHLEALRAAPTCAACGGTLRPDVVLFGERLPAEPVDRLQHELFDRVPDLVLIAGTTAVFPYILEPVWHAHRQGRLTVEVNPEPTAATPLVGWSLRGKAGDVLPEIAAALLAGRSAPPS